MPRSAILRGPAIIQYQGQTFYSQGDIAIEFVQETFGINVANFGKVDDRVNNVFHRISFVPSGRWHALSILYPFTTAIIGSSVFGSDKPLTIWTRDGKKRVYTSAAVTKMPDLTLASTKTLHGEVQFTCLHGEDMDRYAANSLYTDTLEAYPGDTGFSAAEILTQPYALQWGAQFNFTAAATDVITANGHGLHVGTRLRFTTTTTLPAGLVAATDYYVIEVTENTFKVSATPGGGPVDITDAGTGTHTATQPAWHNFTTKDGVVVSFNLQLTPEDNDHKGVYDYTFQSLEVTARLQPEGPMPGDVLAALLHQGPGALRGRSLGSGAADLNISASGVYVRLYNAALITGREAYGGSARRVGPVEYRSTRSITDGAADPLFFVGTQAPV